MRTVLVTDGAERAALASVRALGGRHRVLTLADALPCLAGRSRWCEASIEGPAPLRDPAGSRAAIADAVRSHGVDVVLPVTDAACRALLGHEAALGARLAGPSRAAWTTLSDKAEVLVRAARHGIAAPPGGRAGDVDAAVGIARDLGWPVVLKPERSVEAAEGGAGRKRGVVQASDEAMLARLWADHVAPGAALVQQVLPGHGEGLFVLRWQGYTRAAFAHRRLREKPPEGGTSTLCESIAVDPALLARVEAVLDEAGFDGVAMAEFRCHGSERWLMEFNVRFWGSLQLALDAGVDFPTLLVAATLGEPPGPAAPSPRIGIRSRWLFGDLDHAIALARGARDTAGRSGVGAALRVLLGPAGPGCRWEELRASDPRPFLHAGAGWLRALRHRPV